MFNLEFFKININKTSNLNHIIINDINDLIVKKKEIGI